MPRPPREEKRRGPIEGQFIVVCKPGSNPRSVAAIARVDPKHVYEHALTGFVASLNQGQRRALEANPNVLSVEPDQSATSEKLVIQKMDENGDPWGLDRIDQTSSRLTGTYRYTGTGAGVPVYVLDTGIDPGHPEFEGRASNAYDLFGGQGLDRDGHGTHVAGTVAGATYGVAKGATIRSMKVLDDNGWGTFSGIIAALERCIILGERGVINLSLGGGRSEALNMAVNRCFDANILPVVAAGNSNRDACLSSPASAREALTVAASTRRDFRASYSNFGACVNLYAPGSHILSALPGGGSDSWSGTSMAAPHVAGVAALVMERFPEMTAGQVRQWILDNAAKDRIVKSSNPAATPNLILQKGAL